MADSQQRLIEAIRQQSIEGVKAALESGADPNAYSDDRSMLGLHEDNARLALDFEQPTWLAILDELLDAGADPNLPCDQRFEEYLLNSLSQLSHLAAMRLALNYGANPNLLEEGETALDLLVGDSSYEETCNLPAWYRDRVLPEFEATQDDLNYSDIRSIWLVARHQRGWAMLRQAGGLYFWELNEGPLSERLRLSPSAFGGLYTNHARPDAAFLAMLGSALATRIGNWVTSYKDPNLLGYEAHAVKDFDYAAHLAEGMAIGQAIDPFLPHGVTLEIAMTTAECIAAKCTCWDEHTWDRHSQTWHKTWNWRDKLSPDWFGRQATGPSNR